MSPVPDIYTIVRATAADIEGVRLIQLEASANLGGPGRWGPEAHRSSIAGFVQPKRLPAFAIVTRFEGRVVGSSMTRVMKGQSAIWRTHSSEVAKAHRGKGLGRAMALVTWEYLRARGVRRWRREVPVGNVENTGLLLGMGFLRVADHHTKGGTPIPVYEIDPTFVAPPWDRLGQGIQINIEPESTSVIVGFGL